MKTTIHKELSREKLFRVLPEVFASQLPRTLPEPITAVIFRNKVVNGRLALKAIEQIEPQSSTHLLFAASDFTAEACDIAQAHHILLVSATQWGGYFWSDQSLEWIRSLMGTHRPLDSSHPDASSEPTGDA